MPERNLVPDVRIRAHVRFPIIVGGLVSIFAMGCSQMHPSGMGKGLGKLLDRHPPRAAWADQDELARAQLDRDDPTTFDALPSSIESDHSLEPTGLLKPSLGTDVARTQNADCGHPGCNPDRALPKLSPAQPIEFPVARVEQSANDTHEAPPRISRPLAPLMVDTKTNIVKTQASSNLLFSGPWTAENPAELNVKPGTQVKVAKQVGVPVASNPSHFVNETIEPSNIVLDKADSAATKFKQPVAGTIKLVANPAAFASSNLNSSDKNPLNSSLDSSLVTALDSKTSLRRNERIKVTDPLVQDSAEVDSRVDEDQTKTDSVQARFSGIKVSEGEFELPRAKPVASKLAETKLAETKLSELNSGEINSGEINLAQTKTAGTISLHAQNATFPPKSEPELKDVPTDAPLRIAASTNDFQPIKPNPARVDPISMGTLVAAPANLRRQTKIEELSDSEFESIFNLKSKPAIFQAQLKAQTTSTNLAPVQTIEPICTEMSQEFFAPIAAVNHLEPPTVPVKPSQQQVTIPPPMKVTDWETAESNQHVEQIEERKLKLENAQFCTEIRGFGQVTSFVSSCFQPNQRTLIYCEVENYRSLERTSRDLNIGSGREFVTRLRGRYTILDQADNVVQSGDFPDVEDVTFRHRRDFYLYFPVTLENLPPGSFRLELSIEDLSSNQSTTLEPRIEFSVK